MGPAQQQIEPVGDEGVHACPCLVKTPAAHQDGAAGGEHSCRMVYCGSLSSTPFTYQFMPRISPSAKRLAGLADHGAVLLGDRPGEGMKLAGLDRFGGLARHLHNIVRHVGEGRDIDRAFGHAVPG